MTCLPEEKFCLAPEHFVVVPTVVDPVVLALEAELPRIFLETHIERHVGGAGAEAFDVAAHVGYTAGWEESEERGCGAGIGDHHLGANLFLLGTAALSLDVANANGAAALDDDLLRFAVHPQITAGFFHDGYYCVGNGLGGSLRIPPALQVMSRDHGVEREGAAGGREPVVPPLRGDEGPQVRIAKSVSEIELRGLEEEALTASREQANGGADRPGHRPRHCV